MCVDVDVVGVFGIGGWVTGCAVTVVSCGCVGMHYCMSAQCFT